MTVNHITRTLYKRGIKAPEQLVEECLRQDLYGRVWEANGRWKIWKDVPSGDGLPMTEERASSEAESSADRLSIKAQMAAEEDQDNNAMQQAPRVGGNGRASSEHVGERKQRIDQDDARADHSGAGETTSKSEQPQTASTTPAFAPSGLAGQIASDLECAGRLALVLELSSRPLTASDLAHVIEQMGFSVSVDEVKRLLAGPLKSYVECQDGRWKLCTADCSEMESVDSAANDGAELRTADDAQEEHALSARTQSDGVTYRFVAADLDSSAFFRAKMEGAATVQIQINTEHPAYPFLKTALSVRASGAENRSFCQLLKAQQALRLLLVGWARYEEDLEGPRHRRAQKARSDWGRRVRRLMQRGGPSSEGPPAT